MISFLRFISFATVLLGVAATSDESNNNGDDVNSPSTYTGLSRPLPLFPGQVTNIYDPIKIPDGHIAISHFQFDIVEKDNVTGEMVKVPLSDVYMHHIILATKEKFYKEHQPKDQNVIFIDQQGIFPSPFRYIFKKGFLLTNFHIINTRAMSQSDAYRCLECPCTESDHVPLSYGWDLCNEQLVEEKNTACSPDTYYGGRFCCEDRGFCLDDYYMSEDDISHSDNSAQSVFYIRYTLTYTPVTPEVRPVYIASCCDATASLTSVGNYEYDIPKCPDDDDVCVHELETIQYLDGFDSADFEGRYVERYVDVVNMFGHLHRGAISATAYIEATGEVLCESIPTYGTGEPGEVGNEPGYITSASSCTFDPPRRMKTTEKIRIVAKYDATEAHTGVMSLFNIAIADIPEQEGGGADGDSAISEDVPEQEGGGADGDSATSEDVPGQEGGGADGDDDAAIEETSGDDGVSGQEGGGTASDAAATHVETGEGEDGFWKHLVVAAGVFVIFATWNVAVKKTPVDRKSGYSIVSPEFEFKDYPDRGSAKCSNIDIGAGGP